MSGTSDTGRRELAVAIWVVVSGAVGLGGLAYAVLQSHGDAIRELVNRLTGGGV